MSQFMTFRGTTGRCVFIADSINAAIEMVIKFDFPRWGLYIRVPTENIHATDGWLSINPAYWRK